MNNNYCYTKPPANYPGKRLQGRYVYTHHLVWWENTGEIVDGFLIHHENENKRDNRFSNLVKMTRPAHTGKHGKRPLTHGTLAGYRRKCRCEPCRDANKDYCRSRQTRL